MKKLMIPLVVMILAGCAQQTVIMRHDIVEKPTLDTRQSFFVHGIGQTKTIDAAQVCGDASRVVRTEVQQSGMDVFLRVVTLGIYTPHDVRIYCSK